MSVVLPLSYNGADYSIKRKISGKEYCKDYMRCPKKNKKDCPINPENNISCYIWLENKCRLSMLAT